MDDSQILVDQIPKHILETAKTLVNAGFEAYFVGGCVRDLMLHKKPKDWDLTTNAVPSDITTLFPHTFYENKYGTVGVVVDEITKEIVEITPYRLESEYTDKRRPDAVSFSKDIKR